MSVITFAQWPELTFPPAEAGVLEAAYRGARVILEYGSGGSTVLAAGMAGKRIFSVESDWDWVLRLQRRLDDPVLPSPATVYHADIGPTGSWGRPLDEAHSDRFPDYALSIWDEPFFRHPDVVLIDGRFRAACMISVMTRIERPVRILFDDYTDRLPYHVVEDFVTPVESVGRMAIFDVLPGLVTFRDLAKVLHSFAQVTYDGQKAHYEKPAAEAVALRLESRKEKRE